MHKIKNMSLKSDRFEKVASRRVQDIISKLNLLANCSNRNNYDYDEEKVRKMFSAIKEQLRKSELKFNDELNKKSKQIFKF